MNKILCILKRFGLNGTISAINPINSGHINSTYKIIYSDGRSYILQRINKDVFKAPEKIMSNIKKLCILFENSTYFPKFLSAEGSNYIIAQNEMWRIYEFIDNSVSYDKLEDTFKICEFGRVLGNFHKITSSADIDDYFTTIENFHNPVLRINKLFDFSNKGYSEYFDFFRSILSFAERLGSKAIEPQIVHNDVKCSNVLFNKKSGKGIILIDFDTVMPGLTIYDFGDGARSACVSGGSIDIEKFKAYCKGYFSVVSPECEEDYFLGMLCISAELSARYFYDFLSGENYFADKTPSQKLKRSEELIKIAVSIIDNKENIMSVI